MKRLEIGVFLPIAKNGFVFSRNVPPYVPSYRDNLAISLAAERAGLDYVFSMAKWRGFGGPTQFWDEALESFSLMAALAAATTRLGLVATINPLLYHPVLMAKMASTVADVSGGRLRLNIITGATIGEYAQMGVIPDDYDRRRYEYAAEWIHVLKRLWHEPRVTHRGEFFQLEDCVSDPKPAPRPKLVCAGTSDEGLRFTARETDVSFVSGRDHDELKRKALRAKTIAVEEGTRIETAAVLNLVMRDTRADAEAYSAHLIEGADIEALTNVGMAQIGEARQRSQQNGAARLADKRRIYFGLPVIGSPADAAEAIADLALDGDVDSILLTFPDYLDGLERFRADVMPLLRRSFAVGGAPAIKRPDAAAGPNHDR